MARIRSIHPGLFTDEDYVDLTYPARILLTAIWCEAWDDGVFEWKPKTLKMKYLPADNVEIEQLLAELVGKRFLTSFEVGGKLFGACRNFRKFQSPKKPNSSKVLPDNLRSFVSLDPPNGEPDPNKGGTNRKTCENQLPTSSPPVENQFPPDKEREKEREKENKITDSAAEKPRAEKAAAAHVDLGFKVLAAMGIDPKDPTWLGNIGITAQWLANGWSQDLDILPTVRAITARRQAKGEGPPRSLNFFTSAIGDAYQGRLNAAGQSRSAPAAVPLPLAPEDELKLLNGNTVNRRIAYGRMKRFFENRAAGDFVTSWMGIPAWGDMAFPGTKGCVYPPDFVAQVKQDAGFTDQLPAREAQA